jgi:hypothetical protein
MKYVYSSLLTLTVESSVLLGETPLVCSEIRPRYRRHNLISPIHTMYLQLQLTHLRCLISILYNSNRDFSSQKHRNNPTSSRRGIGFIKYETRRQLVPPPMGHLSRCEIQLHPSPRMDNSIGIYYTIELRFSLITAL